MADTIADLNIANATWTDLYAGTSITVGTAVGIYNKGSHPCVVAIKATSPSGSTLGMPLHVGPVGSYMYVSAGESGLWAYCPQGTTQLLVQE